jgi:hypothetical protein
MGKWKRVDEITLSSLPHLKSGDICGFAYDYLKGGFQRGPVNENIINFKKAPDAQGQHFRNQAISKFSLDASGLFNCESGKDYFVTAIPSSKAKNDPGYDNRFEDFFKELKKLCPCIEIVWPVSAKATVPSAHQTTGGRNPQTIMQNYQFDGFGTITPERLMVFDDVLTTGAHFRAFKDFLINNGYAGQVVGIFWAKTK